MRSRIACAIGTVVPLLFGCALEPPFELAVTFVGPLEIEAGAGVRYQGVTVGKVEAMAATETEMRDAILGGMDPVDAYNKFGTF